MTGRKKADSSAAKGPRRRSRAADGGEVVQGAAGRLGSSSVARDARRAKGVAMLLGGTPTDEIARVCGVTRRQVQRWAEEPEVRQRVQAVAAEAEATAAGVLIAASRKAAETLVQVLDDPEASASDRTRAALAVLDRTGHGPTSKQEHTGADGGPVQTQVVIAREEALSIARRKE